MVLITYQIICMVPARALWSLLSPLPPWGTEFSPISLPAVEEAEELEKGRLDFELPLAPRKYVCRVQ